MEVSPLSRWEIRRRVRWLYADVGIARRLINGRARLIVYQTPQTDTKDEDWNTEAFENFSERMTG